MHRFQLLLLALSPHFSSGFIGLGTLPGRVSYSIARYPPERKRYVRSGKKIHTYLYVSRALHNAVRVWSKAMPGKFFSASGDTTIKVKFYSREHGDDYSFDGQGGEVAHTFFPAELRKGEIHVDADEPWGPRGRNLEWVLAHEIGHALGLPHIPSPSLMAEDYQGFYEKRPKLHKNDLIELRELYDL